MANIQQGLAANATSQTGLSLNLFDLEPAVPDANTLLSLKMLKEANSGAFDNLAKETTRFLAAGLALVRKDPYLRIKLGGDNITAAMKLAPILKQRAEEKHIQNRIDEVAVQVAKSASLPENLGPLTETEAKAGFKATSGADAFAVNVDRTYGSSGGFFLKKSGAAAGGAHA